MPIKSKYLVATRPSLLAVTQTEQTVNLLRNKFPETTFELVKFSTQGDQVTDRPLTSFGGTGVFVKELEYAIERGEADFAVHSLKDVPSDQPEGFILAAFTKRQDPRDVILTRDNLPLSSLPDSCVIGTSSPRRLVQIQQIKPNAVFKDIRGNVDSRIRKLMEGEYDAIVLAAAGLNRLGKEIPQNAFLSVESCIPAIGQGIIALECKSDDKDTIELLRSINNTNSEIASAAERKFMAVVGGGCKFPLAVYATIDANKLMLNAMIGNHFTGSILKRSIETTTDMAEQAGENLAEEIKKEAESLGINFSNF